MADIRECRHIMPSGLHCQSPAMRGNSFCYFHGRRIPPTRKASSTEPRIEMPATLDRNGILHAIQSVLQGLADGRVSARRGSILLCGLQMAANHPETSAPAPTASAPDPLLEEFFSSAADSDEAASLINALAAKLGLGSPAAPPRAISGKG